MKKATFLALMIAFTSVFATVSFAGTKPDTPVPKIKKQVIDNEVLQCNINPINTMEVNSDVGLPVIVMERYTVEKSTAEITDITVFLDMPQRQNPQRYWYLSKRLCKGGKDVIRPPSNNSC